MEEAVAMSRDKREYLKPETVIIGQDGGALARIDGLIWPPINAKVELGNPNRDAVVREVRLQLHPEHAVVCITVDDLGRVVQGGGA
jgi:hypothetical protein